jgi:hypothetical protein
MPTADTLFPRVGERRAWPPEVARNNDGCHTPLPRFGDGIALQLTDSSTA